MTITVLGAYKGLSSARSQGSHGWSQGWYDVIRRRLRTMRSRYEFTASLSQARKVLIDNSCGTALITSGVSRRKLRG